MVVGLEGVLKTSEIKLLCNGHTGGLSKVKLSTDSLSSSSKSVWHYYLF